MEQGITEPAKILDELKKEVISALKQTGAAGESKDGMDIALLTFDEDSSSVQFAGAYNSLYCIQNGVLNETRGNKQPIGFLNKKDKVFTNHTIELQKGDTLYIFSDGYADQFGGPKGKKLKYGPFKELLLSLHEYPMPEQEEKLRAHFDEWKDHHRQTDDVCIIGVKI